MNYTKIIAIANQKGGVGKTTTTFNLGAALALKHNKKVLLVDLDPQGNLSEYLGFKPDGNVTIAELIGNITRNAIVPAEFVKESLRYNEKNKLYYLPADISLANAETLMSTALSRETILKRILSPDAVEDFDYVLIDCLPSLGVLLINALTAADGVVIPVQTQKFSLDGLQALNTLINQVRSTINPALALTGILPTMADYTNVSKNALTVLTESYEGLFETVIHKSVEAAKSSESGNALCSTKNKLGAEYCSLAVELLQRNVC